MSVEQWILFVALTIILFFVSNLLRRLIKPKTRLILSFLWLIIFATWFVPIGAPAHFTGWQLVVLAAFIVAWLIIRYLQYVKYRRQ